MACLAPMVALLSMGCPTPPVFPDIPACGPDTLATAPPLDMLDLATVGPMGGIDPFRGQVWPTQALAFYTRSVDPRVPEGEPARVPVVAPSHLWVQSVRRSFFTGRTDEFSVSFKACNEVTWTLDHLVIVQPELRALVDDPNHTCGSGRTLGDETSFCEGTSPGIEYAPGAELGLAGSAASPSLGVTTRDTRSPLVVFAGGRQEKFTCPLDSFDPAMADTLRGLLGTPDGRRRTAEPRCGEYMQDVRGTPQGNWVSGSDGSSLALAHDNVDPGVAVISLRVPFIESNRWRFTPTHSGNVNREFREVTADGTIYCYDSSSGGDLPSIVLVKVEGESIRFEKQDLTACGAGPWAFNLAWSNLFVR